MTLNWHHTYDKGHNHRDPHRHDNVTIVWCARNKNVGKNQPRWPNSFWKLKIEKKVHNGYKHNQRQRDRERAGEGLILLCRELYSKLADPNWCFITVVCDKDFVVAKLPTVNKSFFPLVLSVKNLAHFRYDACIWSSRSAISSNNWSRGGLVAFFLACEDFGKIFENSFPACVFFF